MTEYLKKKVVKYRYAIYIGIVSVALFIIGKAGDCFVLGFTVVGIMLTIRPFRVKYSKNGFLFIALVGILTTIISVRFVPGYVSFFLFLGALLAYPLFSRDTPRPLLPGLSRQGHVNFIVYAAFISPIIFGTHLGYSLFVSIFVCLMVTFYLILLILAVVIIWNKAKKFVLAFFDPAHRPLNFKTG